MIKQIVLQVGRKIIDFFAWFDLVIISILLIFGVFAISVVDYEFYIKVFMTIGALVIAIILFMVSILCKYFTYLFIDIRDNTAKMTNNDENTEELNKSISKVLKALGITVITVIVVGLLISVVDYTQRTLHNQVGNFKITTLNKSIKNKNKYSDTKSFKRYGFKYSAEDNKQLKILAITPNSNADKAGIKVGDVFLKVNNYDISKGFIKKKIAKEFKKDKLNIQLLRGNDKKNVQMKRLAYDEKNFGISGPIYTNIPYMYLNSYDFSDKYALGYFKIYGNVVNNDYVKKGVVCNCDPKEKSITSIWFGNYEKGVLTEEENYISLKRLQEEKVYPNTHGDIMWQSMCQLHNTLSEKQKVDYKKNFKD